jgi:N-acetylneuraminic acid mutarotase
MYAVSWMDNQGQLFLFGGYGMYQPNEGEKVGGRMNDLWRYNPSTNVWSWLGGSMQGDQSALADLTAPTFYPGKLHAMRKN